MQALRPVLLLIAILFGIALQMNAAHARNIQTAIFAGGCFWCVEADFDKVPGVVETTSGFTGGTMANPTYKDVTKGGTGHYEAVLIRFDADRVSYRELVDIFWRTVDPLDAGGQFCDRGASYRTAIFATPSQRSDALESKAAAESALMRRVVTKVLPVAAFYPAEANHQNYYKGNKRVITRFGVVRQKDAYKKYRDACGRDQRVREIWGDAAPFAGS
ncbi:MAG: peptide-methionine (S)-S-oxide reductase MsrA [Rhodobacteraceae bacterium]|nr:peptide-methionine (S)-S-oxide reductase MsrA [Paracoccaceae bacterium]